VVTGSNPGPALNKGPLGLGRKGEGCLNVCRNGILRHQFHKRLESFAPSYSQSLLLADFKENHTLLWFKKSSQKIHETRKI
jgi:hypothetical protein